MKKASLYFLSLLFLAGCTTSTSSDSELTSHEIALSIVSGESYSMGTDRSSTDRPKDDSSGSIKLLEVLAKTSIGNLVYDTHAAGESVLNSYTGSMSYNPLDYLSNDVVFYTSHSINDTSGANVYVDEFFSSVDRLESNLLAVEFYYSKYEGNDVGDSSFYKSIVYDASGDLVSEYLSTNNITLASTVGGVSTSGSDGSYSETSSQFSVYGEAEALSVYDSGSGASSYSYTVTGNVTYFSGSSTRFGIGFVTDGLNTSDGSEWTNTGTADLTISIGSEESPSYAGIIVMDDSSGLDYIACDLYEFSDTEKVTKISQMRIDGSNNITIYMYDGDTLSETPLP
jgi:hypothetical protein